MPNEDAKAMAISSGNGLLVNSLGRVPRRAMTLRIRRHLHQEELINAPRKGPDMPGLKQRHNARTETPTQRKNRNIDTTLGQKHRHNARTETLTQRKNRNTDRTQGQKHRHNARTETPTERKGRNTDTTQEQKRRQNA